MLLYLAEGFLHSCLPLDTNAAIDSAISIPFVKNPVHGSPLHKLRHVTSAGGAESCTAGVSTMLRHGNSQRRLHMITQVGSMSEMSAGGWHVGYVSKTGLGDHGSSSASAAGTACGLTQWWKFQGWRCSQQQSACCTPVHTLISCSDVSRW